MTCAGAPDGGWPRHARDRPGLRAARKPRGQRARRLGPSGAVIDRKPPPWTSCSPGSRPSRSSGYGDDRDVLEQARLERADAFVAPTAGDNRNIVAALTAKRRFRVPNVVARIYDPERAEIYRAHGIMTVSPVSWSAGMIRDVLLHPAIETETEFETARSTRSGWRCRGLEGCTSQDVTSPATSSSPSSSARAGRPADPGDPFERDDVVRFVVAREAYGRFESFLGMRG